ncbi:hypothetical protein [Phocaeicola sartorii]|uniref:hypothetical protein n=1 Tax=Phocaeicola sartorii TaxID=671267 RepID=UPI0025583B67|nr:hypothetical protein [Phocaeicola sartorii]
MGEFINVLVSKRKSNLIPERDNLYGQFVGEWDFEWVDHQGTADERHIQGEWIFAWVLEGTAVQDVFICPLRKARIKDYQPDAAYATTVRMYNPDTGTWDILYTELGGATQLEGKRDGNRIVQTEVNEKNIQWVFSEITTTSFRWQRIVKRPDDTWETEAELFAVRR